MVFSFLWMFEKMAFSIRAVMAIKIGLLHEIPSHGAVLF